MARVRSTQKLPMRARRGAREAADQRHGERNACRGRDEILDRQPRHLDEVAHRALAAVVLPVGVGHERDGGVEGEVGRDGAHAGRIERQRALETLEGVEENEAGGVEGQHGKRVGEPVLLLALARAGGRVERALERGGGRRSRR